jgi:hypothetical protein
MNSGGAFAIVLAAMAVAVGARAAECGPTGVPSPFIAHYDVKASRGVFSLEGEATLEFKRSGNDYTVTNSMNAAGLLSSRQESFGALGDGIMIPVRYVESSSRRAAAHTAIDWRERRVTFADGSHAQARATLQDRASVVLQAALALRARPDVTVLEYPVASLRRVSLYRFERRETEKLDTSIGSIEAVHFERIDSDGGDRLDVWLAPTHCGVPLRIRLHDHRGLQVDQRVRDVRFD